MSRIMGFLHDRVARAGHCVDYFAAEDVPDKYRGRAARFAFPRLVWRRVVDAQGRGEPYDVVNVHERSGAVVTTRLRGSAVRTVVTSHGLEERAWALALEEGRLGRGGPHLRSRIVHPLTTLRQAQRALRNADHVFCLNQTDRTHLIDRYDRDPTSITHIVPGADTLFAEAAKGRQYGTVRRLLFAATWRPNKGILDLVPAFEALAAAHADLELVVLGAGVLREHALSSFTPATRSRVRWCATANERETAAAFAEADIFLLPSLFEGTPLTLMEAMMSGLPIVTTRTCGMQDVIRDGENGLLIPIRRPDALTRAVNRLCEDPALRARLGRTAQSEALASYTWDRVAQRVVDAYQHLAP